MEHSYLGEIAALSVSICWAVSSTVFEKAGKIAGSLNVNYIRLFLAFIMLGILGLFTKGSFFPANAGRDQWIWLSVSGFLGFFIGDLFLFQALTIIGARLSMVVMTFSPALTALIGFVLLKEELMPIQILAIFMIIAGILMTFIGRENKHFKFKMSFKGFMLAVGGALGQSFGLIFSKKGIGDYDPFAATQIRIITGFIAFTILILVLRKSGSVLKTFKNGKSIGLISVGSFFGPGVGVGLSMVAISLTETGIASALMALTPIVLFVPSIIKGRRIATKEIIGAFVSVGGVIVLFL
jgi:drug/metabolite transporter (DMT)-like permease